MLQKLILFCFAILAMLTIFIAPKLACQLIIKINSLLS